MSETGGPRTFRNPCHPAPMYAALADGVVVWSCSVCGTSVIRLNPVTGKAEWLDGKSPWSAGELRKVEARLERLVRFVRAWDAYDTSNRASVVVGDINVHIRHANEMREARAALTDEDVA